MIPTRESLLSRLRDVARNDCWTEFFDTYWKLIFNTARKSGLSSAESEDVVQETMLALSQKLPTFNYDPERGSFKGWLMQLTRWKIVDQVRKRQKATAANFETEEEMAVEFAADWERDWQLHLAEEALRRVRDRTKPKKFQAFHTSVIQGKGASETARLLRMSVPAVYMATFKVKRLLEKEAQKLEKGQFE